MGGFQNHRFSLVNLVLRKNRIEVQFLRLNYKPKVGIPEILFLG